MEYPILACQYIEEYNVLIIGMSESKNGKGKLVIVDVATLQTIKNININENMSGITGIIIK